MGISSVWNNLPSAVRTGIGVGVGVATIGGAATAITMYATRPRDSEDYVRGKFDDFDRDDKNGIQQHEQTRHMSRVNTQSYDNRISDDYVTRTHITTRTSWTESMRAAANAADELGNADKTASWKELAALAMTFDTNQDGKIGFLERRAFQKQYGVEVANRIEEVLDRTTSIVYSPLPKPEPPRYEPPTSGGDSGGRYEPPTSGGDSGGGRTSSGNSTSNGNAEW